MLEVDCLFQLIYVLFVGKLQGLQVEMYAFEDTCLLVGFLRSNIINEKLVLVGEQLFSDEHEVVVNEVKTHELAVVLPLYCYSLEQLLQVF